MVAIRGRVALVQVLRPMWLLFCTFPVMLSSVCRSTFNHKWIDEAHRPIVGNSFCSMSTSDVPFDVCDGRNLSTKPFPLPSHYQPFSSAKLHAKLQHHNASVVLVGDSLQYQMYRCMWCLVENERSDLNGSTLPVYFRRSNFLAHVTAPYRVEDKRFDLEEIQSEDWVAELLRQPTKVKVAVLNTGPWWSPSRIYSASSRNRRIDVTELVTAYGHHFSPTGRMEAIARTLRSHNVILVWRDTAPAGQCKGGAVVTTKWTSYYEKFEAMNAVARRFVLRHGGHVLPHVWDIGVARDDGHIYGSHGDALHWCNYSPQSVPWMWMTVLHNELDAILAKGAATNVSEPSKSKHKGSKFKLPWR
eukprot:gene16145-11547_t